MKKPEQLRGTRAHQRYRLADGTIVPGVTTITGNWGGPGGLVRWANNLGLQGIDSTKYVDQTAQIGTLAHEMVQQHLGGPRVEVQDYSPAQVDKAENALLKFFEWEKGHRLETLLIEEQMVSETCRYGGSVDWYGRLDGVPTLVDFKTSKSIHDGHRIQVSAYRNLLQENGHPVDRVVLLRIGRTDDEGFEALHLSDRELAVRWNMFRHLVETWWLEKGLKEAA